VVCAGQPSRLVTVMLCVYGDESMDETKRRVCAVAGVIGPEETWEQIERYWAWRTNGVPFHATNCDSDREDYSSRPHWENKALYRDLAQAVGMSGLAGFGVAIDLRAQRQVFPHSFDLAYYKAFMEVMLAMKNFASKGGPIRELIFDSRSESDHNAGILYGNLREDDPEWEPLLPSKISFEFSRNNPRIQVSDLVARETMKALDNERGPVKRKIRGAWKCLLGTERFLADAYSSEFFEDLKAHLADLEKKVQFNQQDYLNWLKERGRQHNTTNLFHFQNWIGRRDHKKESRPFTAPLL
jgi:hypothetical protein